MVKRYRLRSPRMSFGRLLFPLLALLSVAGLGYATIKFFHWSTNPYATEEVVVAPTPVVTPVLSPDEEGPKTLVAVPAGEQIIPAPTLAPVPVSDDVCKPAKGKTPKGKWVRIVKSTHAMYVCNGSDLVAAYPVALGKNPGDKKKSGDGRTPEGNFSISQIQDSSAWVFDYKDGKGPVAGVFGPWFLRLKMPWSGIGICGTHRPEEVGTNSTGGAIKLRNEDVGLLKQEVAVGTPVIIEP